MGNTVWRLRVVLIAGGAATAMGCGNSRNGNGGPVIAHERLAHAPALPPRLAAKPLAPAPSAHPAPSTYAAAIANASVDSRVLVLTANGTGDTLGAIENTLQYLGTPFDVIKAATTPLTADILSTGTHGKYSAVFLDGGDLSVNGAPTYSDAEFTTLATYEASFGVRRVSLYTSPSTAGYGLTPVGGGFDASASPVQMTCTQAGRSVFVGANCDSPVNVNQGFVYAASPADGMTLPLLVDARGNVYAATRTYSDGREALMLTFSQASYLVSYLEMAYGLVSWATRGLFVGERHTYATPQIDDLFLFSDIYPNTGTTFRLRDTDLQAFANWENATRAQPLTAGFRAAYACNGQGSQSMPGDPLTAKAVALGSTFAWLNHTWDHMDLMLADYATTLMEFTENDQYLRGLGLMPYATTNAVTPDISGLQNAQALQAMHDAGITQIVGDTSVPGEGKDLGTPNAGFFDVLEPDVLVIPRIATELYYNVSQPAEWIAEYEVVQNMPTVSYDTIIGTQSDALSSYMLNGNNYPWMFHQADTRNYDGAGHSLLSDLLDASFAKYAQVMTLPIVSPTMDDLAQRVRNRMTLNGSGVVATVVAGTSMTVSVTSAATVPVTGLCTPGAESYAGQTISYLQLAAGQSMTYSLTSCSAGTGGAGGAAGAGATGAAGMTGAAGNGAGGATGAAGTMGAAGNGAAGTSGVTGAAGSGTAGNGAAGTTGAAGNEGTGGAAGSGAMTGAAGRGEGEGDASAATGGKGGAGEGATGGGGGHEADAGSPPPKPPSGGCSCSFGDDLPGPGAFLFSLLGGGLALRGRGRRAKSATAPQASGSC